jgi:hypothetical protein
MTSPTTRTAAGPLRVSTRNPRYFTPPSADGTERAVYLTGSHIWNNLHDGMGPGPEGPADPERFDFDGYLRFLTERGHNFIRLWRWEVSEQSVACGEGKRAGYGPDGVFAVAPIGFGGDGGVRRPSGLR